MKKKLKQIETIAISKIKAQKSQKFMGCRVEFNFKAYGKLFPSAVNRFSLFAPLKNEAPTSLLFSVFVLSATEMCFMCRRHLDFHVNS